MKALAPYRQLILWLSWLCCAGVVALFFFEPFKFPENGDDLIYINLLKDHSIPEIMHMFPVREGIYLSHFDGRYVGNLISLLVFSVVGSKSTIYFVFELLVFLTLATVIHGFLSRLTKEGYLILEKASNKILLAFLTACTLFGLLFDGRFEVFYWISSIGNHLASIILFLLTLALFLGNAAFWKAAPLLLISFSFGMMNEAYALCFVLTLPMIRFLQRKSFALAAGMSFAILVALYLNFSTTGTSSRLHEASVDFSFLQAVKDTAKSLLFPLVHLKYWPIKIVMIFLFVLSVNNAITLPASIRNDRLLIFNRILFVTAILSVFMQCYLLRMECPYRGQIFYYLVFLYFVFLMACLKTINPLKIFFA